MSAYLDEELRPEEARRFERHMMTCAACAETLRGVHHVRLALCGLGASGSPASFKFRLSTCLHEDGISQQPVWIRSLALSLALVVALAILLWPESDQVDELTAQWQAGARQTQVLDWAPHGSRWSASVWTERFVESAPPGPYSHAQTRSVSYSY